jgi:hypothetical protein
MKPGMRPVESRFYAVNDRSVMMVTLPDGGADVLALDLRTGAFFPDRSYFLRISDLGTGKDVDRFTEAQFWARVGEIHREIVLRRVREVINWAPTGDGEHPYEAQLDGRLHTIRVNDFPAEPLYTLLVEGQPIADLEDWPPAWTK